MCLSSRRSRRRRRRLSGRTRGASQDFHQNELIRDEAGNPAGMWAIVRDISERKTIEQTLRESEARYRELLDNSMQGVFVFQDKRIVYINQAVTDSFGYTSRGIAIPYTG